MVKPRVVRWQCEGVPETTCQLAVTISAVRALSPPSHALPPMIGDPQTSQPAQLGETLACLQAW